MAPLTSQLFAGDTLLQDIADDVNQVRISQTSNSQGLSVVHVQQALLLWRAGVLPVHGPDGTYGPETAAAVHLFKVDELGLPEAQVIDDVGPLTVQRLDEIARASEPDTPADPDPIPAPLNDAVRLAAPVLLATPGVLGVGAGFGIDADDQLMQEPTVHVLVSDESLTAGGALPAEIGGVALTVTPGAIELLVGDNNRYPDVKGGIEIMHPSAGGGGGTLGAVVKDAQSGELLALTNQHVVGDPTATGFPEIVYQPVEPTNVRIVGTPPSQIDRTDAVGAVVRSESPRPIPGVVGAIVNDVDAAVFKLDELPGHSRTASPAIVDNVPLGPNLINAVKATGDPRSGLLVRKRGFASLVTTGIVVCGTFHCCWGDPATQPNHHLVEQAYVLSSSLNPVFAAPGDSGSLVLDARSPTAVGLLWAQVIRKTGQGIPGGVLAKIGTVERRLGVSVAWA
jgi:hypothetical protein